MIYKILLRLNRIWGNHRTSMLEHCVWLPYYGTDSMNEENSSVDQWQN